MKWNGMEWVCVKTNTRESPLVHASIMFQLLCALKKYMKGVTVFLCALPVSRVESSS